MPEEAGGAKPGRMPKTKPLRLADLDPQRTAEEVVQAVYARAYRDARALGLILRAESVPAGVDPKVAKSQAMGKSAASKAARTCAAWAIAGRGTPEEVAIALRELRSVVEGVELGRPVPRELRNLSLTPATELVVVAAEARLALADDRAIEAIEVATLASLDERSIRAAAAAGALPPVGPARPMRFAANVVRQYLYERGVPGFAAPPVPAALSAPLPAISAPAALPAISAPAALPALPAPTGPASTGSE